MRRGLRWVVAVGLALSVLAACGGDSDDDADATAEPTEDAAEADPSTTERATTTEAPTTTDAPTTTAAPTSAPTTSAPAATGETPWQDLGTGDCIGTLPPGTFTTVDVVDCATSHQAEAITAIRGVPIQGRTADEAAQAQCDQEGAAYAAEGLAVTYILETQGTLIARAVCLVVNADGTPMTGSVAG